MNYTIRGTSTEGVALTRLPAGVEEAIKCEVERVHVATWAAPGVLHVSVVGEVDSWTLDELTRPLRDLDLDDGVHVQLDVTHLRFADVAAVRQLGCFARQAQHTGHQVTTCGAGITLRKVAALLGVTDDLGLV